MFTAEKCDESENRGTVYGSAIFCQMASVIPSVLEQRELRYVTNVCYCYKLQEILVWKTHVDHNYKITRTSFVLSLQTEHFTIISN